MDRVRIVELHVKGYGNRAIAEILAKERPYRISHVQVFNDLRYVQRAWEKEYVATRNEGVRRQLEVLHALERKAWEAMEKSEQDATETRQKVKGRHRAPDSPPSEEDEVERAAKRVSQCADPAYMRVILEVHDRIAKLMGLNAPERQEISGVDGKPIEVHSQTDLLSRMYGDPDFRNRPEPTEPASNGNGHAA